MKGSIFKYSDWLKNGEYLLLDDGYKIFTKHFDGDGRNVLLLHGFPTSSFDWAEVIEKISGKAKLTAFDFLGFGASDKPEFHNYNFEEQADIAEDVAEKYGIETCVLVAHDYGTTVAQELIRRQLAGKLAFKIEKVILLNGGIYHRLNRSPLTQKILALPVIGKFVASLMTLPRFQKALDKTFAGKYKVSHEEASELWHGITQNDGQKAMPSVLTYIAERHRNGDIWESAMEKSTIPTVLIWGLEDPVSTRHVLNFAKTKLTRAEFIELPDVAHYPQIEAPDVVADAILKTI